MLPSGAGVLFMAKLGLSIMRLVDGHMPRGGGGGLVWAAWESKWN